MKIRSLSWGAADLSWSVVIEEILHAAELDGHQVDFISTNGVAGMKYWNEARSFRDGMREREMRKNNTPYGLDLTFTVPVNYHQRFLPTSKVKLAITDYESHPAPANWKLHYNIPDAILAGSNWVKDALIASGCPQEKLTVVPHGVDTEVFNSQVKPFNLKTNKKFKFLCIAEPHYRKQIDALLNVYARTFTASDDVCLVIKTKIFKDVEKLKEYEQDLKPVLSGLIKKYGSQLPEIKVISQRLPSLAPIYTSCNAFVLMTAAEGFGIPFLEAMACGLPIIAPRFGGQLDFLNDQNSILCDTVWRPARPAEQYWGQTTSKVGKPNEQAFSDAMIDMVKNYENIKTKLAPQMAKTVDNLTWKKVWKQIEGIAKQINPKCGEE